MKSFVYDALPSRIVFGKGAIESVGDEMTRLDCKRAIVLSTHEQQAAARQLASQLGTFAVGLFPHAVMHTPVEVTDLALRVVEELRADCVISLGGGSTIGLGKAIALRTDLPQIAIPTTYAGSEATPILGETELGVKRTQRTLKVLPEVVIYDVNLTLTLPQGLSTTSGINAIAHAVEALYAKDANPIISALAVQGIASLAKALPVIAEDAANEEARASALFGAWACGTCLGSVGMSLHHKLCHVLGGTFDLPHSETHTIVLPHALAYNASAVPEAMTRLQEALETPEPAAYLFDLAWRLGAPVALHQMGMLEQSLPRAVDLAVSSPYWNPRPVERTAIAALLADAFHGRRPRTA
ncbi:maleylacetate reductase [Burkholderia sp. SG-MS1]|uniref:maleylacetate reductase n=1 Tax=Paraburkholderia sp. SG-MS1 TaxID=2023741 RepID=UPI0014456767|nr:maleylacetate reductase [Paraburkholderia sp. SG-MS1]NKJ49032.1 maleylacetate reductase [Paraburkholderia sp. SG-MS1]